ncbi:hypothetical protein J421_1664 [Gemmatirosa kalamazoonensis]|uniref:Uncharacterized protein n=1 Tax=Gemmatirosa kalamazoonensis TaxID=861299 RepID=W0REJ5_9BACT|nr:hypothetical protein [Gemmatirosa kalamazoonensis]AHG89201.1 hypothetical protein J421_1664 [Gemmatirosa kalamazoonensis]
MRRALPPVLALALVLARPSSAQTLSQDIQSLFKFGTCAQPLCLSLSGPSNIHVGHYIGSSVAANGDLLGFLNGAIGATLGSIPISASTSGATFRFVNGAPVSTATSAGPIFAERAQTLGRGGLLLGVNTTRIGFNRLRGTSLKGMSFNFKHADAGQPGLGDFASEYDYINVKPALTLNLQSTAVFATYGVSDRFDIGVAVPVVYSSLRGTSNATILNWAGAPTGLHYFGTDPANPQFTATTSVNGTHTGIGDVALRAKANVVEGDKVGFSIMGDGRLPTGDADNFTGTGHLAIRALGILSARMGNFSPHVNGGYAFRSGDTQTDAVLLTAGFDQLVAPKATIAVDLISELEVGSSPLTLPETITFAGSKPGTLAATNIPERTDNVVNVSAGAKFQLGPAMLVVNGILPLGNGGMQARSGIFTLGLERTFH